MLLDEFRSHLVCIVCCADLTSAYSGFVCTRCGKSYPVRGRKLWAVPTETAVSYEQDVSRSFESRLKNFFQKVPWFYRALVCLFAPGSVPGGFAVHHALSRIPPEARAIVNLGSGTKRIAPHILNLDVLPFENVDVVADMEHLPFRDGSLDMVISECALEHVPAAPQAIVEITRVVKPGGFVYVVVPFLYPYHESPNDYFRWTKSGLIQQFSNFEQVAVGMWAGPMATLVGVLAAWLALLFSVRSRALYTALMHLFLLLLAPLKLLDPLFRLSPMAEDIASVLYFFGRKKF